MKNLKKLVAAALILCLTLTMGITAFAADNTTAGSITIKSTVDGKTYDLYKIFDLTYTGTGSSAKAAYKIADAWKDFFNNDGSKYIVDSQGDNLNQIVIDGNVKYINITDGNVKEFTKDALEYAATKTPDKTVTGNGNDVTATGLALGYYLVYPEGASKTDQGSICSLTSTVPTAEVNIKAGYPDITKTITGQGTASTASIGDKVPYTVEGTVPDMTGYKHYVYVLDDTMSKGLTFNNDVVVKIGDATLDENAYEVTAGAEGENTKIEIVIKNFIQYKDKAGVKIAVTYSATLNEKAAVGTDANTNRVKLTYSNDPKKTGTGDKPEDGASTGITPEKTTKTYTSQIELTKVDGADKSKTLTGAKFKLEGNGVSVTLINKEVFKKSETGTYYMLKNGTYTETEPADDTKANYDSTTQKYEKVTVITKDTKDTGNIVAEGYVDSNGKLIFTGLAAGTYTITELVAPEGYNLLTSPITVTIGATLDQNSGDITWSQDGATGISGGTIQLNVENNTGAVLPGTGGMGTTIFYLVGALMMLGAVVVFVTRRKMSSEK